MVHSASEKHTSESLLSLGLMSGTSMDGVDAAILRTDGRQQIESIASISESYPPQLRLLLKSAEWAVFCSEGDLELADSKLSHYVGEYLSKFQAYHKKDLQNAKEQTLAWYRSEVAGQSISTDDFTLAGITFMSTRAHLEAIAALLADASIYPQDLSIIGYHGQSLFHAPEKKITVQMGDPELIVDRFGIPVVFSFRSHDIRQGGQGAPLAPVYHAALLARSGMLPATVLNLGGIANVTIVPENAYDMVAFDTGPGNGMVDRFVTRKTNGLKHFDAGGRYGAAGAVDSFLLNELIHTAIRTSGLPYFDIPPPKSLDANDIQIPDSMWTTSTESGCRTLEAFTAECIVRNLKHVNDEMASALNRWIIVGGGAHNPIIATELHSRLVSFGIKDPILTNGSELGWSGDTLEAELFAYLAVRSLRNLPLSFPGTTGVSKPACGGEVHGACL